MDACTLCGGPLVLLGHLGSLTHLRCRNCGGQFSVERDVDAYGDPVDVDEPAEGE